MSNHNPCDHLPWQPIETAPKDGSEIVLWCAKSKSLIVKCCWSVIRGKWVEWAIDGFDYLDWCPLEPHDKPTHWLRIIPPPASDHRCSPEASATTNGGNEP
jgi:hypothetical protein